MKTMSTNRQRGAVSLFVVIFSMLIITVITISFLRLMMTDQQQASDNDLSQSAYDSATAGVEDAKRALLRYQQVCTNTPSQCAALSTQLSTNVCNAAVLIGGVVSESNVSGGDSTNPGEIKVQQSVSGSDAALDQAYTCLTMKLQTDDYVGNLTANQSQLVPLIGVTNFDTVTVRWFSKDDITNTTGAVSLTGTAAPQPLLQQTSWPNNRPSIMQAQLIQFGDSFTLNDFDMTNSSSENDASTVFLYPTSDGAAGNSSTYNSTTDSFVARDTRKSDTGTNPTPATSNDTPLPVKCASSISGGGYACSMTLALPNPIGGGNRTAFLRLTPFYNATHFQVALSSGGAPNATGSNVVKFKDVQPEIDSTGRANDLFRRVQSRVNLYDTSFPYPDATIDITGNFCKDFTVTDKDYIPGSCTP